MPVSDDELEQIILDAKVEFDINPPTGQTIKATLRALIELTDIEIHAAIRAIDGWTNALIDTAALKHFRASKLAEDIPQDVFALHKYEPKLLRELARAALKDYSAKNGRRNTSHRYLRFAVRLVNYWEREFKERATVMTDGGSPFDKWAGAVFNKAGFESKDRTRVLRQAIRMVHFKPTR